MRERLVRKIALTSAAAALAAGALGGLIEREAVSDDVYVLHKPTMVERVVDDIAAQKFGEKIVAHCAELSGWTAGKTRHGGIMPYDTIRLAPIICERLRAIIMNPERVDPKNGDMALAVETVAHEYSHIDGAGKGGQGNEDITDCLGDQRVEEVAMDMGVPESVASIMADTAGELPSYPIPNGCFPGGKYDIHALGGHFPHGDGDLDLTPLTTH